MSDKKQTVIDFLKQPNIVSLATVLEGDKPWARPVMAKAGDDLNIYINTGIQSRKVAQIKANPNVHLSTSKGFGMETEFYVQVQGTAEVSTDLELKNKLWQDELSNYFSGPEDPNYVVIIVKPQKAEYWSMQSMEPEVFEF